jgi:hypothetical protein
MLVVQPQATPAPSTTSSATIRQANQAVPESICTIDDLLRNRATTIPTVPIVAYPRTKKGLTDYVHYTAKDLDRFAEEAAKRYLEAGISSNVSADKFQSQTYTL